ncbi:MAG: cobyrinic acid a,c-diamide synthase [Geobacter sp.]|nr:MAG: cobyrinic acid a,c-diamide synthase [Geobacter sp.]
MKSIIIAAPMSGSGKTTVTLGIMECLKRRGLKVAPFKVGPDYIDPGYHRLVTGRPSINLDGWMCPPDFVRETFMHHAAGADVAVIEGVMGLFDGVGGVREEGSTAQVAKLTGAPVILVVDARGQARSVAALVKGFADFDPLVRVAGVIFNNVASENHARILRESVESLDSGPKVVGWLPRESRLDIPSRHLGLLTAEENPLPDEYLDHLAAVIRQHIDLGLIWTMGASPAADLQLPFNTPPVPPVPGPPVRIAVARDEAFCFVYEDNLRLLQEAGAEIAFFSPLRDEALPADIGGIYLPGGYPEMFADALADNMAMKGAILDAIAAGTPLYAECGGFIYLTRGVLDTTSEPASLDELLGVFPVTTRMLPRRKALGYREIETVADSIIGPAGTIARGHEFHYSEMEEIPAVVERLYRVRRQGTELEPEGYRFKQSLASYIHLHFGSSTGVAAAFVESCRQYSDTQKQ